MRNIKHYPAAIGLCAILLSSTAHGAEARQVEGVLPDGTPYQITVPDNWNGIVVNDLDSVTNLQGPLAQYLLETGYAYTGTGRHAERMTRHNPLSELDAQAAVIDIFHTEFGNPERAIQYGCSGGGYIALAMAEMYPDRVDGVVSLNARGTGGLAVAAMWLDLPYTLKALLAPDSDLLVAPVPNDALPEALDAWRAMLEEAQETPEGRARIALAVTVSQWPTWASSGGQPPEKPNPDDLASLQNAMFRSALDGVASAVNRRQLYDNPEGVASWNTGIEYAQFYEAGGNPTQKAIVEQLYQQAGLDDSISLDSDLEHLDAYPRVTGTAEGVGYWLEPGRVLGGNLQVPTLHIHGLGDALLPPHLTEGYAIAVVEQGKDDLYRQGFLDIAGHCSQSVPESMAAIDSLLERLETGEWGDTAPAALNVAGEPHGGAARFIEHSFATPFNRAFYPDSPHPFN